jgi:hypothetical protein
MQLAMVAIVAGMKAASKKCCLLTMFLFSRGFLLRNIHSKETPYLSDLFFVLSNGRRFKPAADQVLV